MRQIDAVLEALLDAGFDVKPWRAKRIYFQGQHKTISAYLDFTNPTRMKWPALMGGVSLIVNSTWRSNKSDLHAKGVKHTLTKQLFDARLIAKAPPKDWREISPGPSPLER